MPPVLFPAASRKEAYFTCNLSSVGVCLNFCGYFDLALSCDDTNRQDIVFHRDPGSQVDDGPTESQRSRYEGVTGIIQRPFLYFSVKTFLVAPHLNRLAKTVLMRGHKVYFYGHIRKIIPKLSGSLMSY